MSGIIVASVAALNTALKHAVGGSVILLTPGTWPGVTLYGVTTPGTITITSQYPNNPAVMPWMIVSNDQGLTISNITINPVAQNSPNSSVAPYAMRVVGSQRITLTNLSMHGSMDNNPQNDINGLYVTDSQHIILQNSEFQQLFTATTFLREDDLLVSSNNFHDLRDDAIDVGGTSNVKIANNMFTNFYPVGQVGANGDHADAIQFWTTNTTSSARNIVVSGNTFTRGTGSWVQGTFMTDQTGHLPYYNVQIVNNVYKGSEYNGIMVVNCDGLVIRGNTVQPYAGMLTYVKVQQCTDASVTNNNAGDFIFTSNGSLDDSGNTKIAPVSSPQVMLKP